MKLKPNIHLYLALDKIITVRELWEYYAMTLISKELETFSLTHETQMRPCLPCYFWRK